MNMLWDKFINLIILIIIMEMTTIAVQKDVKAKIDEFGNKGETYSDILLKLYAAARKVQIRELLMDDSDTVSAEEALENAKKRWS